MDSKLAESLELQDEAQLAALVDHSDLNLQVPYKEIIVLTLALILNLSHIGPVGAHRRAGRGERGRGRQNLQVRCSACLDCVHCPLFP